MIFSLAFCIPDLFMKTVQERGSWYLLDPHEVRKVKGYSIEDSWGEEWERPGLPKDASTR